MDVIVKWFIWEQRFHKYGIIEERVGLGEMHAETKQKQNQNSSKVISDTICKFLTVAATKVH